MPWLPFKKNNLILGKDEVTGSNPVSGSSEKSFRLFVLQGLRDFFVAGRRDGFSNFTQLFHVFSFRNGYLKATNFFRGTMLSFLFRFFSGSMSGISLLRT
jgi:hypothetical protein